MRPAASFLACLALGLGFADLTPASAQVVAPQRKPGMWEMSMLNSTVKGMAIRSQMCTDAAVEKRFSALSAGEGPSNCSHTPLRRTATGFEFESTCKAPGGRVTTTRSVATGDFQKDYRIEMTSRSTPPPPGGPASMVSSVSARWLGPCPAGRKPGDMITPNGMVINLLSMQGPRR